VSILEHSRDKADAPLRPVPGVLSSRAAFEKNPGSCE